VSLGCVAEASGASRLQMRAIGTQRILLIAVPPIHLYGTFVSNIGPCPPLAAFMGENPASPFVSSVQPNHSYITFPTQSSMLPEYKHVFSSEDISRILAAQSGRPS
jgi:hypothetical protein